MSMHVEGQGARIELVNLEKQFEDVVAVRNTNLTVQPGEFLTLLGPSGCGKTTTLRMIGGFEYPTGGSILIDGNDVAALPPYRRPINTVFQQYALFPHMTVAGNVGYGLEMAGVGKAERDRRVGDALAMVRLANVEKRRPSELSGGQQQRVALARALVNRPKALLLDEPLGALDLRLRRQLQLELKRIQQEVGITFVHVTHDQEEAMTMADEIAVMNLGRVEQRGSAGELYEHPRTAFVAQFLGTSNLIDGRMTGRGEFHTASGVRLQVPDLNGATPSGDLCAGVRPEKIDVVVSEQAAQLDGAVNVLEGEVAVATFLGTAFQYIV